VMYYLADDWIINATLRMRRYDGASRCMNGMACCGVRFRKRRLRRVSPHRLNGSRPIGPHLEESQEKRPKSLGDAYL
jgi:hypothetical protein